MGDYMHLSARLIAAVRDAGGDMEDVVKRLEPNANTISLGLLVFFMEGVGETYEQAEERFLKAIHAH